MINTDALMRLGPNGAFLTVRITYTNHRHEREERTIKPVRLWWGHNTWHVDDQWIMDAFDWDRGEERSFALASFDPGAGIVVVANPRAK
jgi:hypothetical protein